jgi:hypothetical protein
MEPNPTSPPNVENPFRRIFNDDGSVNQEYVLSRLGHLEKVMQTEEAFLGLRFDREVLEGLLARREDLFQRASEDQGFEPVFREFAEFALAELVTAEFDEGAKELLRAAVQNQQLSRRDRAAAACGLVLSLPGEGEPVQPHHENPFFDLILRVTYNESVARAEFLSSLDKEEELSEMEREAKIQEFLRRVPALLFELKEGFRKMMERALTSYERGEYSFGMGMDMLLHGVREVRILTQKFEEEEGEAYTDTQKADFSETFGQAIADSFSEDIGEDEEEELFARMGTFLEDAKEAGKGEAEQGLSAALSLMYQNPEVKHRLLLAAYHESVTGKRIFADAEEEKEAIALYESPFDVEPYLEYGDRLIETGQTTRAERVFRSALEFFPEDQDVRARLTEVAEALAPEREAILRQEIEERTQAAEEE